jgi:hypothetical protein
VTVGSVKIKNQPENGTPGDLMMSFDFPQRRFVDEYSNKSPFEPIWELICRDNGYEPIKKRPVAPQPPSEWQEGDYTDDPDF